MALDDVEWEFYQCTVGELPASIRVDVGVHERAPLRELKHSMRLRVVLRAPRPDGMTSDAEAPALWDLEEKLRGGLPETRLVGIVTNAGHRDFYFYSSEPNEAGAAAEQAVRATMPEHTHECGGFEDAAWEQYFGFLYPNALAWQWIQDCKTLEALKEQRLAILASQFDGHYDGWETRVTPG